MSEIRTNAFNADEKMLRHLDKLDRFFNGHKTLIVTELDLTNRCNNRCPGCCGVNENNAELSHDQVTQIVGNLRQMDNRGVILSGGGEPLISPEFEYAVLAIRKNGMKIGLNSNGLALDEHKARLIAENCEYFRVSLDAGSPEMYKKTHGMPQEAYYRVIENMKLFSKVRNEMGSRTSFGVGFLTSEATRADMENFIAIAKDCGTDFAQFRPFTGDFCNILEEYDNLKQKYQDDSFQVKASIQKYREMSTEGERNYSRCSGMFFSTVITADAKMYACLHHRQEEAYFLGQIGEKSIEDIFLSSRIREVYQSIDCNKCPRLCRNDVFNRTLKELSSEVNHIEFL